jgi:hypothetical protein
MTDRDLMQMALDALEVAPYISNGDDIVYHEKAIETLRTALAQPERAECDGGQCGIGGYCKQCPKTQPEPEPVVKLKELLEVQGREGTWNYDPYFHGMYNGMEVMLAVLEDREPVFRGAPEKWLSKKEWQGLTDEEIAEMHHKIKVKGMGAYKTEDLYRAIEQVLKEKNT